MDSANSLNDRIRNTLIDVDKSINDKYESLSEEERRSTSPTTEYLSLMRARNVMREILLRSRHAAKHLKYEDTCPNCDTYNEIFSKRWKTVGKDVVYCWHCGQAIQLEDKQN